ncbi:TonB-dependent receptor [Sphingosinicellaceae bacterium]|nr:TonB-dependent receptor [Sphingosinicellaceae bacterium]
MIGNKTLRSILLAGVALGTPGLASAADDAVPAAQLNDIIVTAQRRSEKLQEVPIQVTVLSAETIEKAGIKSTADALMLVPNVTFDESFTYLNSFITVRGLAQINNADAPVAVIVDGVPQNSQKQLRMDLFDIERIEVLKGPQGGLYGRNALGGAINIVTKRPTNDFEGFLDASYGNGDAVNISGAVSGPIIPDTLLFRASGSYKYDGGRIDNAYTGKAVDFVKHDYDLRGQLNYIASDRLQFDLRASYRDFSAGSIYDSVVLSGDANDFQSPRSNIEGLSFGHVGDYSLKADYDFGGVTLTSITAHTDLVESYRGDLDFDNPVDLPSGFAGLGFQAGQGQDLRLKLTSQELRLVSDSHKPFRWILGGYYLHTKRSLNTQVFIDLDGSRAQYDNQSLIIVHLLEDNSNDAYAAYGQFDYDINDALTLSGALRYDHDRRDQTDEIGGGERVANFSKVQPKVTLTYKIDPSHLLYATYSTGFRSGGYNAPTVVIPVYKAETLTNYEAGFKTSWLDNRLRLNGAVYLEKDHNYQSFYIDVTTGSQIIGNIDRVNIWGVELEAQALVAKGLELTAALGTTDTDIRRNTAAPDTVGNHTPKTTPWTLNLGAQYSRPIGADTNLILRADFQHRTKKYWQVDNLDVQQAVNIVNLRAGIEKGAWSLYGFGRNVFNVKYYSDFNPGKYSGAQFDIGFRAQPATYGVEAKVKF